MAKNSEKINVAILGSGNIGTDLLIKCIRSPYLNCSMFIGRRLSSPGITKANSLGVRVSDRSIDAILDEPDCCDIVFDATTALDHLKHWPLLQKLGKIAIDLTPSKVGMMCIPAVNLQSCLQETNVNMVSCGGQVSTPIAYIIGQTLTNVEYIEVVSTIASRSAGPGTRVNIDEYIDTTEKALRMFSKCSSVKAILNLNPAQPPIDMQTTVFAKVTEPDLSVLGEAIDRMVSLIKTYVPGYKIVVPPTFENGRLAIMVRVQGAGDYLPKYAGNLDIINCAAVTTAEAFAKLLLAKKKLQAQA